MIELKGNIRPAAAP